MHSILDGIKKYPFPVSVEVFGLPMLQSASSHFRDLRGKAAILFFVLLAACGGGNSSSGGAATGGQVFRPIELRSIAITPENPVIQVGTALRMVTQGAYSDGVPRDVSVSWESSAPEVAEIAANGSLLAVSAGITTITATTEGFSTSTTVTVRSATITYLHVFGASPNDSAQPNGPLLQASDGNFYGTTRGGGSNPCEDAETDNLCGTIFRMTPSGTATVLHSFGDTPTDGWRPTAPLMQARDGALYGMTLLGGAYNLGTVFRITLTGDYSVIHSFGPTLAQGAQPRGGLIEASDGYLYGTTVTGGTGCPDLSSEECGTVFRISPGGEHQVLYSFASSQDAISFPVGGLIQGNDGNFYGTTSRGGNINCNVEGLRGCGTVYKMTPAGVVTVLHAFGSSRADATLPNGPLIAGDDGAFYGVTSLGGGGQCYSTPGCGTVYRITLGGQFTVIYAFSPPSSDGEATGVDGYAPGGYLIRGRDGNFYGTTESATRGLTDRNGIIFRLTPSGVKTILYWLRDSEETPSVPLQGLVQARDGSFYGVTEYNGRLGSGATRFAGTVFRLMPN